MITAHQDITYPKEREKSNSTIEASQFIILEMKS